MDHNNTHERVLPPELERAAALDLSEGLYAAARSMGLSFTEYLETMDPSDPSAALDAFERQLAVHGIRIQGEGADVIDRFFASKENSILFPEFVSRAVKAGMLEFRKLDDIVATRTRISDNTYKSIYMDDSVLSAADLQLARVSEGAELPKIELKSSQHSITIHKYGRFLEATYEAIRRKKASVIQVFLRAIGTQIQKDKFAAALDVLINGDGNNNAAPVQNTAVDDTLGYADLIDFSLSFAPYSMNVVVAPKAVVKKILSLSQFEDPAAFQYVSTGDMVTPFGARLLVDENVPADTLIGLDRRFALEEVYETGVLTESDRLIRQQIEGTAISEVAGFAKLITSACRVLDINWT